jgi:hypothetical protein
LQPSEDEIRSLIRTVEGDIAALGGSLDQAVMEARADLMRWVTEVERALASDRIATESHSRLDPEEINALAVLASLEAESELQREVSGE